MGGGWEKSEAFTRGTFRTMQVTTPPTESPLTLTASMASIIFPHIQDSGTLQYYSLSDNSDDKRPQDVEHINKSIQEN